ncbi:solute carrier family 25 member 38 [Mycena maculata]|uniref:Solute carrier family 25 member 38 n=1 Tax=Mycena maculata TaxID=230809 RepID=A0AAD7JGD4_9AGAR|nr:solute carrier family 25 member 38 [Mycena maculata]
MSNVGQQLFSGALSGFASTVCLQPFDLLKTRLQQGDGRTTARQRKLRRNTTTLLRTTQQIIASQGFIGLWRGRFDFCNWLSLFHVHVRNVPGVALYMTSLTQLRSVMAASPYFSAVCSSDSRNASVLPKLTSQGNLIAGATTRVAVGFLLNPFSVLKARYESNMYAYKSLTGAFLSIARLGPSELFRGFFASSLRDAPYAGIFVVLYEGIKRQSASILQPTSDAQSTVMHTVSAASAGAIATMATHPFDVIKTKVQVRSEDRYHGFQRTARTIWAQRGLAGFFDGASLRMSRKILSSAIGWAVYEGVLMFIRTSRIDA